MTAKEFTSEFLSINPKEAGSHGLSVKLHKKELDAKLRVTLYLIYSIGLKEVWEDMGQILLCGEGADEYYDLISTVMVFLNKKEIPDLTSPLVTALDNFCDKVPENVYCTMLRTFALKYCSHNGTLYSYCAILHSLLIEWYKRGMQSCGWDDSRVSLFGQTDITLLEFIILLFDLNIKFGIKYLPVRPKDIRAIKSVLNILNNDSSYADSLINVLESQVGRIDYNTVLTSSLYSAFENIFCTEKQANVCLHFLNIEREDFTKVNFLNGAIKLMVRGAGTDILKYRRLFVREAGVTIRFNKNLDNITEVTLREIHKDGLHYIYVAYCLEGRFYRNFVLNIEDLNTSFMTFMYEIDISLTIGILCWLGLKDRLIEGLDAYQFNTAPGFKKDIIMIVDTICAFFEEENLHYSEPAWWNYDSVKSKPHATAVEFTKLVSIGTYSRKLPRGQQASESAKALAKKYCMILDPGYTLVEGFERRQKVRKQAVCGLSTGTQPFKKYRC